MIPLTCRGCGATFQVKPYRKDKARFCSCACWTKSEESKKIVSNYIRSWHEQNSVRGEANPNWKGGATLESRLRLTRKSWRKLKKKLFEIYNNECVYCKSKEKLVVHHILPYRHGGKDIPENLEIVCSKCHPKIEGQQFYAKIIQEKCKQCMGNYEDGKDDCILPDCPLYPMMPYGVAWKSRQRGKRAGIIPPGFVKRGLGKVKGI